MQLTNKNLILELLDKNDKIENDKKILKDKNGKLECDYILLKEKKNVLMNENKLVEEKNKLLDNVNKELIKNKTKNDIFNTFKNRFSDSSTNIPNYVQQQLY